MRARKRVRSLSRQSGRMLLALPCVVLSLGRAPVVAGGLRPAQRQVCAPGNLVAIKQAFVRGMKEKDLKVLELYAPDAVFTNPDGSNASGEPLRQLFVSVYRRFDSDLHLQTTHVFLTKTGACVEQGSFSEHLRTRANGQLANSTGKYRFTYVPTRSGWRFQKMKWVQLTGPK
jgi:ketosteroid isomerase-like protein